MKVEVEGSCGELSTLLFCSAALWVSLALLVPARGHLGGGTAALFVGCPSAGGPDRDELPLSAISR